MNLSAEDRRELQAARGILLDEEGYADFQIDWAKKVMLRLAGRLLAEDDE